MVWRAAKFSLSKDSKCYDWLYVEVMPDLMCLPRAVFRPRNVRAAQCHLRSVHPRSAIYAVPFTQCHLLLLERADGFHEALAVEVELVLPHAVDCEELRIGHRANAGHIAQSLVGEDDVGRLADFACDIAA